MSIRRLYESTYIVNAVLEDAEIDSIVDRLVEFIGEHGAQILEMNKWGRRRLAYPIKKKYNGYYVYLVFEAPAEAIPQLERFYDLDENIMRHLTVQLDPKLREFRKVRAEAQAARAAQMAEAAKGEQFDVAS
ncbi:MAG: 30S ribosomal protein S6 [Ignavibacteria bacterium]|nr:30S ribosomal protein S6 [Ignavibacteria bacterium]